MLTQTPQAVVMIRPHHFYPNHETRHDNGFQSSTSDFNAEQISQGAYTEVTQMVAQLRAHGVTVHLFEDMGERDTPDSVFPNNWFSTHHDGSLYLYPMRCSNRRREVREDILNCLQQHYHVKQTVDLRHYQQVQQFLEGTGSVIFDHPHRLAYASLSQRSYLPPLQHLCTSLAYRLHAFHSYVDNMAIYHTNVMLCIGSEFALVGLDTIIDDTQRNHLVQQLTQAGKQVIELSTPQILSFAGNALELAGTHGKLLALSSTALASLHQTQITTLEKYVQLLPLEVNTIQMAGGSVRCMLAGIHLPSRSQLLNAIDLDRQLESSRV